jgi:hypothetical protein
LILPQPHTANRDQQNHNSADEKKFAFHNAPFALSLEISWLVQLSFNSQDTTRL